MRRLREMCWLVWAGLIPTFTLSYPLNKTYLPDSDRYTTLWQWEHSWIRYTIAILSLSVTAFMLAGCLCCRRHRRAMGFQDKRGKSKQEFKNGSTIGPDLPFEQSMDGLAIDVPRMIALTDRVQFEPLPVDRIISGPKISSPTKPTTVSPLLFTEDADALKEPCREWFEAEELSVPREKLKYLREIGRGWFGKVVEGRADLNESQGVPKNGGVVVRILAEEATTREKAWFLGEATPYLKLHHQNVLALLGFCLETDPYLLLFESCPAGDLKGFLLSNRDVKSQETLMNENVPTKIALEIAAGLQHMHNYGFAHTDLSARNCLVASDLSAKLGDYGTGVEKYPEDYYIVGDRALPIRWSAPESLECTDTTIETREITAEANIWSFAVLLWEIVNWGSRPYDSMGDEEVIQMLLSLKTDFLSNTQPLQNYPPNSPSNILRTMYICLNLDAKKRPSLNKIRQNLLVQQLDQEDFDQQWNKLQSGDNIRSASLRDLRGSVDSDCWASMIEERATESSRSSFRLGPNEPVKNVMSVQNVAFNALLQESGSETEEDSWRARVERGAYTEKVKQKSKSVADLMVLVHIDPESDGEWSMGTQITEKPNKKKLSTSGSDGDLTRTTLANEFNETLRKLRSPMLTDPSNKVNFTQNNSEQPKLLTLTVDQEQTPILRLSIDSKEDSVFNEIPSILWASKNTESTCSEEHILRLLTKEDPNLPLLRYVPDCKPIYELLEKKEAVKFNDIPINNESEQCFSNNFVFNNLDSNQNNLIDVLMWNHALDSALEHKIPGFSEESEFKALVESSVGEKISKVEIDVDTKLVDTVSEFSKENFVYNVNVISNAEEIGVVRRVSVNDDEERKHLSTPDDEQSSDSGFRDKESCEEEENVDPSCNHISTHNPDATNVQKKATEEEQLQVLLELDTILDAEYYFVLPEPEASTFTSLNADIKKETYSGMNSKHYSNSISDITDMNTIRTEVKTDQATKRINSKSIVVLESLVDEIDLEGDLKRNKSKEKKNNSVESACDSQNRDFEECSFDDSSLRKKALLLVTDETKVININSKTENYQQEENERGENEEEDSSTMSLCSDNSYISFGMEEEFVTAIRNELREKLPRAQMSVVEVAELQDDENSSISSDVENKRWEDEDVEESLERGSNSVDISIRYNIYGTPLSPILEERESTVTSESLLSNSRDASIVSKESVPSEDVLLVDTRTNKVILLEGSLEKLTQDDDRDTTNGDMSDEENAEYGAVLKRSSEGKTRNVMTGGAPLPSPEEESKWQQLSPFPLPLPLTLQDDLMSTSFAADRDWESQDEDEKGEAEEDDEDNSSSSGEFVWKRYHESYSEQIQGLRNSVNDEEDTEERERRREEEEEEAEEAEEAEEEEEEEEEEEVDEVEGAEEEEDEDEGEDEGEDEAEAEAAETVAEEKKEVEKEARDRGVVERGGEKEKKEKEEEVEQEGKSKKEEAENEEEQEEEETENEEEEEEEFTPSAWNATLAPHRSALRSPDKTLKSGDQKKSVWFKKQRYHCVYEYPKETLASDNRGQTTTTWEPTSYTDWEELMDEPRLDMHPLDYDDISHTATEEFYVSSSNRPFQFQSGDSRYITQFFPGACLTSMNEEEHDEIDYLQHEEQLSNRLNVKEHFKQSQLGELRHTRDRLKLNLLSGNKAVDTACVSSKQTCEDVPQTEKMPVLDLLNNKETIEDQCNQRKLVDDNTLPKVPREDSYCEVNTTSNNVMEPTKLAKDAA